MSDEDHHRSCSSCTKQAEKSKAAESITSSWIATAVSQEILM